MKETRNGLTVDVLVSHMDGNEIRLGNKRPLYHVRCDDTFCVLSMNPNILILCARDRTTQLKQDKPPLINTNSQPCSCLEKTFFFPPICCSSPVVNSLLYYEGSEYMINRTDIWHNHPSEYHIVQAEVTANHSQVIDCTTVDVGKHDHTVTMKLCRRPGLLVDLSLLGDVGDSLRLNDLLKAESLRHKRPQSNPPRQDGPTALKLRLSQQTCWLPSNQIAA